MDDSILQGNETDTEIKEIINNTIISNADVKEIVDYLVKNNKRKLLKWVLKRLRYYYEYALYLTVVYNRIKMFRMVYHSTPFINFNVNNILDDIIKLNRIKLLKNNLKYFSNENICSKAVIYNNYKVLKIMKKRNLIPKFLHFLNFADNMKMYRWLVKNTESILTKQSFLYTSKNGNLKMLMFFRKKLKVDPDIHAMYNAIENNHLHIVKWLIENTKILPKDCVHRASVYNRFEMMKYLHSFGDSIFEFEGTESILDVAIKAKNFRCRNSGHTFRYTWEFKLIKYLVKLGYTPTAYSVCLSIQNNCFHITNFLIRNGAPINDDCINKLISMGKLRFIKWIHQNKYYEFTGKNLKHAQEIENNTSLFYYLAASFWGNTYNSVLVFQDIIKFLKNILINKILILYSKLENPREKICMVCHDDMKPDSKIVVFKCQHFVCEECSNDVYYCCFNCKILPVEHKSQE